MEDQQIVDLWRRASSRGEAIYLATLIHVEGSSYRKPGARMLVTASGERVGTISGGCLEAEVARKIAWLARDGAIIHSYRTTFEEDGSHPYGSGCGGTVWLLMESGERASSLLLHIAAACEQRESSVALYNLQNEIAVSIHLTNGMKASLADVIKTQSLAIEQALHTGEVVAGPCKGDSPLPEFVCVPASPPPHLYVFGAGDDARPLVEIASQLGWHITVADGRAHLLTAQRFSRARRRELLRYDSSTGDLLQLPDVQPGDLAVVLTHSFDQDRAILKALLNQDPRYIGVLGPRHRTQRLLESILGTGEDAVAAAFARIHTPVGLPIGAKDPSMIALSILAEMQAKLAGKSVTVVDAKEHFTKTTRPHSSVQDAARLACNTMAVAKAVEQRSLEVVDVER